MDSFMHFSFLLSWGCSMFHHMQNVKHHVNKTWSPFRNVLTLYFLLVKVQDPDVKTEYNVFGTYLMTFLSYLFLIITFPISIWFCVKVVKETERSVIMRLGRIRKNSSNRYGLVFVIPWLDRLVRANVQPQNGKISLNWVR